MPVFGNFNIFDDDDNYFDDEDDNELPPTINLRGPDGNALALIAIVSNYARTKGWSNDRIRALAADMTHGNYELLLGIVETNFPEIDLVRD